MTETKTPTEQPQTSPPPPTGVTINLNAWYTWGRTGAESHRPFGDMIDEHRDSLIKLTPTNRQAAGNALMEGWITGASSVLSPERGRLATKWGEMGLDFGALDASARNTTDMLSLAVVPLASEQSGEIADLSAVNQTVAIEELLVGYIRGFAGDVRARVMRIEAAAKGAAAKAPTSAASTATEKAAEKGEGDAQAPR